MNYDAYAALAEKQILTSYHYEPEKLGPWDIEVKILCCGICYSDVHLIDNDWQISHYPLVPGHEIIGIVQAVGDQVNSVLKGQRVGVGWQRSSCMHCEWCHQGEENLCDQQEATCVDHPGGFANFIRVDSRFAFKIPDSLESEHAAPLLCGGATVFSPFIQHKISATSKVAVIGIGGLGHLALQFSKAFGCETTAISTSAHKEEETRRLGANHFIVGNDIENLQKHFSSFDFILSTTHSPSLDLETFMQLLRPKGIFCCVGVPASALTLPAFSLIAGRKILCGSNIASRPVIHSMLEFAARHHIEACIETFPLSEVNRAIEKVKANQVKYRAVLKM